MAPRRATAIATETATELVDGIRLPKHLPRRAVAEIKRAPVNPRLHSQQQLDALAASISRFGFLVPVVLDADVRLVAGHARLEAATTRLGLSVVPYIDASHLSDEERRSFLVADNRLGELATWDNEALGRELAELSALGTDLDALGFTDEQLAALTAPVVDPYAEWTGMPEFAQEEKRAFRTIVVHFYNAGAVAEFAKLTAQVITEKTRYIWFPREEIEHYVDKVYTTAADEPAAETVAEPAE